MFSGSSSYIEGKRCSLWGKKSVSQSTQFTDILTVHIYKNSKNIYSPNMMGKRRNIVFQWFKCYLNFLQVCKFLGSNYI